MTLRIISPNDCSASPSERSHGAQVRVSKPGFPRHRSATARELEHRHGEEFAVHPCRSTPRPRAIRGGARLLSRRTRQARLDRDGGRTRPGRDHLHDGPWTGPAPAFPSERHDNRRTFAAQAGYGECAASCRGRAQARLMLGNKSDEGAVITVADQTIKLAAHAGEKLAHSDLRRIRHTGEPKDRSAARQVQGHPQGRGRHGPVSGSSRSRPTRPGVCWPAPDGVLLPMRLY